MFADTLARIGALIQYALPHHLLSRAAGRITQCRMGLVRRPLIRWFVRHYKVATDEAAEPEPTAYSSFQAFFTRALRDGARPVCNAPNGIACPADGTLSQKGRVDSLPALEAKGHPFALEPLLGGSANRAAPFRSGCVATVYLAPHDYHRVHMPLDGTLREMVAIPGRAFSVGPTTVRHIPGLFDRNERVVAIFDTPFGPMGLVLIGAMLVATVGTTWAGTITPPRSPGITRWSYPAEGPASIHLAQGAEMGWFNLGSTVVALFAGAAAWDGPTPLPRTVAMGQCLGTITRPKA